MERLIRDRGAEGDRREEEKESRGGMERLIRDRGAGGDRKERQDWKR